MFRRITTLALIGALAAPFGLAAMSLDELIAANMKARGGAAAWSAVSSLRASGSLQMTGTPTPAPLVPFVVELLRPNKVRLELEVQGTLAVEAFDGERGWQIMPFLGSGDPQPLPPDQLAILEDQADIDGPLFDYREKGSKVELLGQVTVDGTEAYKLKVVSKDGEETLMYIDAGRFLAFRQETTRQLQGVQVEAVTELGDYREVGGLLMPYSLKTSYAGSGATQVVTFTTIEIDPPLDASRFERPAAPASDEPRAPAPVNPSPRGN